jgi:hypothetical protein
MIINRALYLLGFVLASTLLVPGAARAGIFNIPHFIPQGTSSLGFEPELTLTQNAGLAANVKYTYGLTELNNVTVLLGTGGGLRRFRFGGNVTFDFFPDIQGQPGIGIAASAIYYRVGPTSTTSIGLFETTAIPYIHKAMNSGDLEFEPFLAIPVGLGFTSGNVDGVTQIVVGSMFKGAEKLRYVAEMGINLINSTTYFSGGVIYYF